MLKETAINLSALFTYLEEYIAYRIETEFEKKHIRQKPSLNLDPNDQNPFNHVVQSLDLNEDEIIVLLIALAPHFQTSFFDRVLSTYLNESNAEFLDFGGFAGKNHRGMLPTGETALFVIAGSDNEVKLMKRNALGNRSKLFDQGILMLGAVPFGEPTLSGHLILDPEYVHLITTGVQLKPDLSPNFPAELINTDLEWKDLVLQEDKLKEILELQTWLTHNETLLVDWKMAGKIKPGYRVMFYGPPGTGKTMTASLLGKHTGRDVYRIDLSMVVSKYIGETEKNLSSLFNKAKNRDWILFFDEADAIFGKRTNVRDAHDKYANQEVSYLLQRIEAHPGLVILASNFKNNIDEAFTRRFSSIVEFALPNYEQRLQLWQRSLPEDIILGENVNLEDLAYQYDITGANIINIIHFACLRQLEKGADKLEHVFLMDGVRREYEKEGRLV